MLRSSPVETGATDAVDTEDMTFGSVMMTSTLDAGGVSYLQVVTRALSRSSTRHLVSLHLSA